MKQITIFFLVLSFSFTAFSQVKITGLVSDTIDVLPGANIIIKGTTMGAITNPDGYFELEVNPKDTISISYIGYTTKDVVIKNQKSVNTVLEIDNAIEEVVVIAGCIGRCKSEFACCGVYREIVDMYLDKTLEENQVKLYPNPSVTGDFNLRFLKKYKKVAIFVANISGQIIQSNIYQNVNNIERLDLSRFSSGIYIINIIADDERLPTKKAIIG